MHPRSRPRITAPSLTTLSTIISAPGRDILSADSKYAGMFALSASMNVRSNGRSVRPRGAEESLAFPTITSTLSPNPARSTFALATSACFGSISMVTRVPLRERARQPDRAVPAESPDLEYPARADDPGNKSMNFPCAAETAIAGNPASSLPSAQRGARGHQGEERLGCIRLLKSRAPMTCFSHGRGESGGYFARSRLTVFMFLHVTVKPSSFSSFELAKADSLCLIASVQYISRPTAMKESS